MGLDSYFYAGAANRDNEIHYLRKMYSIHNWFCNKLIESKQDAKDEFGNIDGYKMSAEELDELITALLHDSAIFYDILYGRGYAAKLVKTLMLEKPHNDMYNHYYNEYEHLLNSLLKAQKEGLTVYYSGDS